MLIYLILRKTKTISKVKIPVVIDNIYLLFLHFSKIIYQVLSHLIYTKIMFHH